MKKFIYLFLILIFTSTAVFADNISKFSLPCGQTLIVKEVHNNPTVIIDTWVKTGSIDEDDSNNGVAHFLEHLFFKGSKNFPQNEFDKIAESKGAVTNAATSKDYTHFYIKIPSKDFETAVKLHADMLLNPLIPQDELEKERLVVIREIERNNDNPQRILYNNFSKSLYKFHPYKREVIGTKDIIANISRCEILDFYQTNYTADNMITVVVGDVDAQKAYELVKKYFVKECRTCKSQKTKNKNYKQDKKPESPVFIEAKEDVSSSYMMLGFKCNAKVTENDSYALDLLSVLMGGGRSSYLYKDIKDKKQLAQSIYAVHSSAAEDSVFYISANFDEQNFDKLKAEIFSVISRYQNTPVSDEELDNAKKMLRKDTLYSRESISDFASEIGYSTVITGDWKYYEEYLKNIDKVTIKDIQRVAKKYLEPEHTVISVIYPKNQTKQISSLVASNDMKIQSEKEMIASDKFFKPNHYKYVQHSKIGIHDRYVLANNAVLISDKHKENEIIGISVKVKGGNYTDKIPGISKITSQMLLSGTKKYSKDTFTKIIESNGIVINPYSDSETYSLSMKFAKQDLPLAMELLNQIVNEADFKSLELEKIKNDSVKELQKSKDYASSVGTDLLYSNIWGDSLFYTSFAELEQTIPTIKISDIKENYNTFFEPKNMVIAINGDVNDKEMINYFSDIFKIHSENKKINFADYRNSLKPLTKSKTVLDYKGKEAAWIFIGWQTDGITNQKDRAVLNVINSLLGNGMSSRLFTEVRAEKGLAYAVGSSAPANTSNGIFCIYIGTDPARVDEAVQSILCEVLKLKKEFVTEKELQDAKNKLKGQIVLALETNLEKANTTASSEINGRGCDYFYDKFNAQIDEVTVSDIISTANKYFSQPYIIAKVLPKK